jgi:seryl-tRNA synthetase
VTGNKLTIHLKSNQVVRTNDALIRIKKELSNLLGFKFKIGIRKVMIDFFNIKIEADNAVDIKTLPYVKNIGYDNGYIDILFDTESEEKLTFSEIEKRIPDRIIILIKNKLVDYGGKVNTGSYYGKVKIKNLNLMKILLKLC